MVCILCYSLLSLTKLNNFHCLLFFLKMEKFMLRAHSSTCFLPLPHTPNSINRISHHLLRFQFYSSHSGSSSGLGSSPGSGLGLE
ncbi:uncharacterized protein DS421_16g549270 [Arachis hypogaea]|nr:uncharacterized protein DS421_16g549270 [Arachis hypogaea]